MELPSRMSQLLSSISIQINTDKSNQCIQLLSCHHPDIEPINQSYNTDYEVIDRINNDHNHTTSRSSHTPNPSQLFLVFLLLQGMRFKMQRHVHACRAFSDKRLQRWFERIGSD